jgi:mitochondrial fission protein ELM1
MSVLPILILSDRRPGHYHLAEGVAAAIARRRPVEVRLLDIRRRSLMPSRLLAAALNSGVSPSLVLDAGYRLERGDLTAAGLVISAGGDTLAANICISRMLEARSIFCGTLRHFRPESLDLIISSYARHRDLPRHIVVLKPNGLDPDTLPHKPRQAGETLGKPPEIAGLLVGGNSGLFDYADAEWSRLLQFLDQSREILGTRWIVSTSRRSPDQVADKLVALASRSSSPIAELIDFRTAGAGTLPRLFASVDAVLVTEDSSTMMSEAVCARLPVVGTSPEHHGYKDDEREYRALMAREGWIASIPLAQLNPDSFMAALGRIIPLRFNHLDHLADELAARLPELFRTGSDQPV